MTAQLHLEMHQDHHLWETEIKFWRADLHAWQLECKKAWDHWKDLESALKKHEETLREHAASIRLDEERIAAHEHSIAEFEMGGTGTDLPGLVPKHKAEADRQTLQRTRHEELKRHHHELIAHMGAFVKILKRLA
jgi:hypothetical protein